jgi:hypothetical protein
MEVHAHTHTPRKKWTHYFWEVLILFLAMFCSLSEESSDLLKNRTNPK